MLGAGLLAKKAVERGLRPPAYVKTSLAPGSKVVTEYYDQSGLMPHLENLGFNVVGYGCTTCIGNSGPLPEAVHKAVTEGKLVASSVLSGNRNFEGRINPDVKANYLASPPLVVAYALAGSTAIDLTKEPLGTGARRKARLPLRHLADPAGGRGAGSAHQREDVRVHLRQRVRRQPDLERGEGPGRRPLRLPRGLDLHPGAAVLPGPHPGRAAARATSWARASWPCSATPSPPTTSRPPATSRRTAPPAST